MIGLGPEDRRLVVLAAVFVPARAEALVGRLSSDVRDRIRDAASRAANRTRRDRLHALRGEVDPLLDVAAHEGAALAAERAPIAAAGRCLASVAEDPARPAFRRLLREQAAPTGSGATRATASRTP